MKAKEASKSLTSVTSDASTDEQNGTTFNASMHLEKVSIEATKEKKRISLESEIFLIIGRDEVWKKCW